MRYRAGTGGVALGLIVALAGPAGAQRAPAPDPLALSTATEMRRAGSSAETVGREVRATFRQSGPQMVMILVEVGFREPEVARAVGTETRSDALVAATWLAEGAIPASSAYAILHEVSRSSATSVRGMVTAGYPLREAVGARQRLHPADPRTHAVELKSSSATPDEVGGVFNSLLGSSAPGAARDLLHAGYSVLEVALALRDGYGLSAAQVAHVLVDENVDAPEVLDALLDPAFGIPNLEAVQAFEGIGGEAGHAAILLRDRGEGPGDVTPILLLAGYDPVAIGDALDDAFTVQPAQVAAFLSSAGVTVGPITAWLAESGTEAPEGVVILRFLGAEALTTAQAMLGTGWIGAGQAHAWTGWAVSAGYGCGPVALALTAAFQAPLETAAVALVQGGCGEEHIVAALTAAFGVDLVATAEALAGAGLAAEQVAGALLAAGHHAAQVGQALLHGLLLTKQQAQAAVVRAVLAGGGAVHAALTASAEAVEATLEETVGLVINFLADLVGLDDAFGWLRARGASAGDAAKWASAQGAGATAVAVALRDGFQAHALAVGNALVEADYDAVAVVTALKDGIGLTYDQMMAISGSMMLDMTLMMQAIQQVYG
jgi:hypothetical protein